MSYKIRYDSYGPKPCVQRYQRGSKRLLKIVAMVVLVLSFLIPAYKSGIIKDLLIPGNSEVTEQATENFVESLKNGAAFKDAVIVFCKEITANELVY